MLRELDINEMDQVSGGNGAPTSPDYDNELGFDTGLGYDPLESMGWGDVDTSTDLSGNPLAASDGGLRVDASLSSGSASSPANDLYNNPEWRAQVQAEAEGAQRVLAGIVVATVAGAGFGGLVGAGRGLATGVTGAYAGAWFNVYNYDQ